MAACGATYVQGGGSGANRSRPAQSKSVTIVRIPLMQRNSYCQKQGEHLAACLSSFLCFVFALLFRPPERPEGRVFNLGESRLSFSPFFSLYSRLFNISSPRFLLTYLLHTYLDFLLRSSTPPIRPCVSFPSCMRRVFLAVDERLDERLLLLDCPGKLALAMRPATSPTLIRTRASYLWLDSALMFRNSGCWLMLLVGREQIMEAAPFFDVWRFVLPAGGLREDVCPRVCSHLSIFLGALPHMHGGSATSPVDPLPPSLANPHPCGEPMIVTPPVLICAVLPPP
ncbi:uncharacterized protein F4807DRAFT_189204 [Annulohypoxylon truncatum]|uniref:uncharacterized protein n=1 Tax=Annulohypoxylon truncatum TaxID=327061 RepID=UPI0020087544|nr:uncharacterized protein F4807DRAFT_189204 [Annulohypoxylon truncatum]KAI1207157.1 hypothetical protein F4807DRAFT_189204 [Annulohypoxylon truncatum]